MKQEIPQSPALLPQPPTEDKRERLTTGNDALEKEESGPSRLYSNGAHGPTSTLEKVKLGTSKPSSTGLRVCLLNIVHPCLESKVDQSLRARKNSAVGAEDSLRRKLYEKSSLRRRCIREASDEFCSHWYTQQSISSHNQDVRILQWHKLESSLNQSGTIKGLA